MTKHAQSEAELRVCDWLAAQRGAMLELLEELVNIDSGSYDKSGVDAVGASISRFLAAHNIEVEITPLEKHGDAISAVVGPRNTGRRPLLLLGHRDTVFQAGEARRRPFRIENGRAYGPGVADMKAGLVMNSFLLVALARSGALNGPLQALYTGDEEVASPTSRPIIEAAGAAARAVFNAEPGRSNGNVVIARRGGVFMRFAVTGKAAHSGVDFASGISAIEELAQKVMRLHTLTDMNGGTTVNVGLIHGGQSVNTVAPSASGEIDLRYTVPRARDDALAAINEILETSYVKGTRCEFEIAGEFLAMQRSAQIEELLQLYNSCASEIGFKVEGEFTGGCADSGLTASQGTPTLCAMGPVGGKPHSPHEYLEVDTIVPRSQALALTLMRLDRMTA